MKWASVFLTFVAGIALAEPIPRPQNNGVVKPDPNQVWIDGVTYGGSGCPQGSASVSLSTDRQSFTVILDKYIVNTGPDVSITNSRKNCQLNVRLHYPGGFQYSVYSSDYRGYVQLDKGVTGTQKATYYFAGNTAQASAEFKVSGPISQDYLAHDETSFTSTVWSPCGEFAALNVNSQIRVDNSGNRKGTGLMTTDSIDGKVTFKVGVQWRQCK
ncbi:secreted protein [Pyronema omphalodes]|nr:secreted protein [Pyronema omphalodes]